MWLAGQDCTPFMEGFDECYDTAGMGGQGPGELNRSGIPAPAHSL